MPQPEIFLFPRTGAEPLTAHLYLPGGPCRGIVYAHLPFAEEAPAAEAFSAENAALCLLSGENWDADFSPWPAPRAFPKGEDFTGGAAAYLSFFCGTVLPGVERSLGVSAPRRALAGYSLSGLFSVYAAYYCSCFNVLASMSGSFWYDGFAASLAGRAPQRIPDYVYFSLGDREPRARDVRLAAVGAATDTVRAALQAQGAQTEFHWESGGHFPDVPGRCIRGLLAAARHLS